MSNLENEKLLEQLWEEYLERGGTVENFNKKHSLSDMNQIQLIAFLEEEIDNLV